MTSQAADISRSGSGAQFAVRADHHAVRAHEILDRRAFAEELRIGFRKM